MSNAEIESGFFDRVAEKHLENAIQPISKKILERYRLTKNAPYFMKEKMFELVNAFPGKRLLEIGCGTGASSVQLAYTGKEVVAFDISPLSIEVAKKQALANDVSIDFRVGDATDPEILRGESFDIVWCQLVLHHLVGSFDHVMQSVYNTLKPGGLFVSCEPVAYNQILKKLSRFVPGDREFTPDECPLRLSEFETIRKYFPHLKTRYYRLLGRSNLFTKNLSIIKMTAMIDNLLFLMPGVKHFAGNVVMWAMKDNP